MSLGLHLMSLRIHLTVAFLEHLANRSLVHSVQRAYCHIYIVQIIITNIAYYNEWQEHVYSIDSFPVNTINMFNVKIIEIILKYVQ